MSAETVFVINHDPFKITVGFDRGAQRLIEEHAAALRVPSDPLT